DPRPALRRGTTALHRTPGTAAPTAAPRPRPPPARHGTGAARTGLLRGSRRTRILGRARSPAARPGRTAAPPAGRDRYPAAAGPHLGPGHGGLRLREPPAAQPHAEPVRAAPGRGERPDQPGPDRGRYRRLVRRKRRTTVVTALAARPATCPQYRHVPRSRRGGRGAGGQAACPAIRPGTSDPAALRRFGSTCPHPAV